MSEEIEAIFESVIPDIEADFAIEVINTNHNVLTNRDLPDQHPTSAITGLDDTLSGISTSIEGKVDKVSTANVVYGTDENGDQTTYNAESFGQVDDVQVGGVSVVTNKIAELGTMAGETASDYYTKAETDEGFATAAQGAKADTAIQPLDNISSLNNDAGYITASAVKDGTLTIQKNGTLVATFTANQEGDTTANLAIPTNASDVGALPDTTTINDLTTTTQLAALNSGATSTNIAQIATNTGDISAINGKIPSAATTTNQLADKDFVNSSIATNTANFIGTFNSVAELEAYSGTLTNNDYAFVVVTDSFGNTAYDRYKYTTATTSAGWQFEYELNNSSFTAAQWAAINSGANDTNIAQITTNQNAIGTLSSLNTTVKTDLVSAVNEVEGVASTALQPNDNISSLTNDSGYITGITSTDVTTALGFTPYDSSNPDGYTSNVGTVTSVNNTSPDGNGNVTISIPAAQVNSDWSANSGVAEILNKPTLGTMAAESASDYTKTSGLAAVALSGAYSDLSGTPSLATVATSGSYNDLSNKPTIPTTTDSVTSGSTAALTSGGAYIALQSYATTSAIANMQTTTNLVTSVSSSSTDSQYPSAKLFYDTCGDIETLINAL